MNSGYTALVAVAVVLVVLGTLCSNQSVLAVAAMAVIGFCVLFAGVFTPLAALGGAGRSGSWSGHT